MAKPEEEAREKIDELLTAAGWQVQDYKDINLSASFGVAVREFSLTNGTVDYLLFVDKKAIGVLEAKKVGETLSGVSVQTEKYLQGLPDNIPSFQNPLALAY